VSEPRYWKSTEFAKELGKPITSVINWFVALEEQGIHYVMRHKSDRVYDELDLEIAQYIIEKRNQKWSLDAIYLEIPRQFQVRPFPAGEQPSNVPQIIDKDTLRELFREDIQQILREELAREREQNQANQSTLLQSLLPSAEEREKERQERQQLLETVEQLRNELKESREYIDNSLNERTKHLNETMQAMLEKSRQESAAAANKGGWFSRLFKS